MALAANDIQEVKTKHAIVWKINTSQSSGLSFYDNEAYRQTFFHTLSISNSGYESTQRDYFDKRFISFELSLRKQYEALSEHLEDVDFIAVKDKMKESLTELLNFKADAFSMELSSEKNIFYTFIKDDYSIFLTHSFTNDIDEDDDEAIISIFKGNNKISSCSGTIKEVICLLEEYISPEKYIVDCVEQDYVSI